MNLTDLDKYKKITYLDKQLEIIKFYRDIVCSNQAFRAAVIVGSFAKGNPDRLSDIDFIVFTDADEVEAGFQFLSEKKPFKVVYSYSGDVDKKILYEKVVFDNFTSIELHVFSKKTDFTLKNPYIEIVDHDNFLPSIVVQDEAPKHEDFPALSSGGDEMGWALHDLFKWWTRGNKDLVKKQIQLISENLD